MRLILGLAAVALLSWPASAVEVAEPVRDCLKAIDSAMEKDAKHDGFMPTEWLDDARILMWIAPYSPAHREEVATMVLVEGVARHRDDHAKQDEVTVKCGLTDGRVKFFDILDGHGIPDPERAPGK